MSSDSSHSRHRSSWLQTPTFYRRCYGHGAGRLRSRPKPFVADEIEHLVFNRAFAALPCAVSFDGAKLLEHESPNAFDELGVCADKICVAEDSTRCLSLSHVHTPIFSFKTQQHEIACPDKAVGR